MYLESEVQEADVTASARARLVGVLRLRGGGALPTHGPPLDPRLVRAQDIDVNAPSKTVEEQTLDSDDGQLPMTNRAQSDEPCRDHEETENSWNDPIRELAAH